MPQCSRVCYNNPKGLAPRVGLEPTTQRLTGAGWGPPKNLENPFGIIVSGAILPRFQAIAIRLKQSQIDAFSSGRRREKW